MTDLPLHEGTIGILRHLRDPAMCPAGLYELNLAEPNQLFHLVGWALSYLVSTRWAAKLVVAAAVVAIPVCAARFARHVGASPLASLLVAPMALGWLFTWGLVANLVGLAALLAMLPVVDRLAQDPTSRRALAAAGGAAFLYFAHEAMMLAYAGAALAFAVLHRGPMKQRALRAAPFVFALALMVAQARWQKSHMGPALRGMPTLWHPLSHKLVHALYILLPATDYLVQGGMFALCALAISAFFWLRARERASQQQQPPRAKPCVRQWLLAHRWETFAVCGLVAFFAFPLTLNGATLVYQRWFAPSYAVLAIVAAPRDLWTRAARAARVVVFTLPVATLLVAGPSFADSSRQYEALEPLVGHVQPGSALAMIDLGPGDPSRTFSLQTACARVLAERGGRLAFAYTDSTVSPVVIPRRYQWQESLVRLGFDSWRFRPAQDLKQFRYVLLRATDPRLVAIGTVALAPEATPLAESGEWVLFESKLEVVPVVSPEPPRAHGSADDDMRARVTAIEDALPDSNLPRPPPAPPRIEN